MVIDCIMDRRDNELFEDYNPHDFYMDIVVYGKIAYPICQAMDEGTEEDVKKALCDYIDNGEYNPRIKKFINRVDWLQ